MLILVQEIVKGPRTIKLPMESVISARGYPELNRPINEFVTVDCTDVFESVEDAVVGGL